METEIIIAGIRIKLTPEAWLDLVRHLPTAQRAVIAERMAVLAQGSNQCIQKIRTE